MNTERNLDRESSYQRLTTTLEWVLIILGILTSWIGLGWLLWIGAILSEFLSSNILVRDITTLEKKKVTRPEWNQYRQEHGIGFWQQYRKVERYLITTTTNEYKASNINTDTADEIAKFKKLLDDGTITQEEFDAKKKQLLGL